MDPRELREATRREHEATEALMPLMGEGLTRQTYVATLRTLKPVVESWEDWAASYAPDSLQAMLPARRRSQWLAADLQALEAPGEGDSSVTVDWTSVVDAEAEDRAAGSRAAEGRARDEAAREASFLGAMYVMEGSTLGGRFLARHVEAVLGLTPGAGDAYFQGHGDATGAMWREVTARIAGVPEELSPVVIAAARRAFAAFGDALRAGLGDGADAPHEVHL